MTTDRVGKLLERVARELAGECRFEIQLDDCTCVTCDLTHAYSSRLKRELEPLLRAGQAMRDDERSRAENTLKANKPLKRTTAATLWDAALATLEGRDGSE